MMEYKYKKGDIVSICFIDGWGREVQDRGEIIEVYSHKCRRHEGLAHYIIRGDSRRIRSIAESEIIS